MKRYILLLTTLFVFITQGAAQNDDYTPFVREGVQWEYYAWFSADGKTYIYPVVYEFKGDTTITLEQSVVTYKKLIRTSYPEKYRGMKSVSTCEGLVRETSDGNIYLHRVHRDDFDINKYPIQGYPIYEIKRNEQNLRTHGDQYEYLVFSNKNPVDIFDNYISMNKKTRDNFFTFGAPKYIEINGRMRKKWDATGGGYICSYIEGIGYIADCKIEYYEAYSDNPQEFWDHRSNYLLGLTRGTWSPVNLVTFCEYLVNNGIVGYAFERFSHVVENGKIVYKSVLYDFYNQYYGGPDPVAVEDVKVAPAGGDSRYYDLQGRPVTGQPAPGIYIQDGKKVLVK